MEKMTFDKGPSNIELKAKFSKALEDKYFNQICKSLNMPSEVLMKYTSTLKEVASEFEHCSKCSCLDNCLNMVKGSFMKASKNNDGLAFSYVNCRYVVKDEYKDNVSYFDLPKNIKNASMKNVYKDDKSRVELMI